MWQFACIERINLVSHFVGLCFKWRFKSTITRFFSCCRNLSFLNKMHNNYVQLIYFCLRFKRFKNRVYAKFSLKNLLMNNMFSWLVGFILLLLNVNVFVDLNFFYSCKFFIFTLLFSCIYNFVLIYSFILVNLYHILLNLRTHSCKSLNYSLKLTPLLMCTCNFIHVNLELNSHSFTIFFVLNLRLILMTEICDTLLNVQLHS